MNSIQAFHKDTPTDYKILDVVSNRWSPRSFSDQLIDQETLNSLFESVRWAPSSMNEQPWRLIVAKKGDLAHAKIVEALMPGNQLWAKDAPVLVVTLFKKSFTRNGAPNGSAKYDLGLAIGNLSAQATSEGIGLHQMGGFQKDMIISTFTIADDYEPVTVIALGYYGNAEDLPEELKYRELAERQRKPINEFVYYGHFNE
ncbi:MAG: nitroreductase family protein [Marinoscillum sp.]